MDPVARRFMWEVIANISTRAHNGECSIILTTHSMEEAEALCTRIGIMVGGVLRCLGSTQRLRSLYGLGYQLEIGLSHPVPKEINSYVQKLIQNLNDNFGSNNSNSNSADNESKAAKSSCETESESETLSHSRVLTLAEIELIL